MYVLVLIVRTIYAPRAPSTGPICICTITERSHCLYEFEKHTHTHTHPCTLIQTWRYDTAETKPRFLFYSISTDQNSRVCSELVKPTDWLYSTHPSFCLNSIHFYSYQLVVGELNEATTINSTQTWVKIREIVC